MVPPCQVYPVLAGQTTSLLELVSLPRLPHPHLDGDHSGRVNQSLLPENRSSSFKARHLGASFSAA
jgi:hypothetical protein